MPGDPPSLLPPVAVTAGTAAGAPAPAVSAAPQPPQEPVQHAAAGDDGGEEEDASLPPAEQLRRMRLRLNAMRDAQLCAVCLDAPKDCMLLPCRHLCACAGCAAALAARAEALCPMCRVRIESWTNVFL
jgi:hypothetical protein